MSTEESKRDRVPLEIHFQKSNDFRTVYASGVFGGISPNSLINVNFFTDRPPLPKKITYKVDPAEPKLSDEFSEREGKSGYIREVHFGVVLDIETAKGTIVWLQKQIDIIEKLKNKNAK